MRRVLVVGLIVAAVAYACGDMSRRLLLVTGGGAVATPPVDELTAFELNASPDGGWIWFTDPRAVTHNGVLYYGFVRGSNGDVVVGTYDEATETKTEVNILTGLDVDDHAGPALLVRASDHKLLVYASEHDGPTMFVRVSNSSLDTDPDLSDGFAAPVDLDASLGGSDYTYPYPIELADGIYLFRRDIASSPTQQLVYNKSANGVSSWGSEVLVYEQAGRSSYWKIAQNGTDRIDFLVSDGHPAVDSGPDIYHFALDGGSYVKSDGTSAGSLPLDTSDLTLVASGDTTMTWIEDAAVDGNGNPVAVWVRYATAVSDLRYMYGRWNGSSWDVNEIAAAGASISSTVGSNYYSGGIALDKDNPAIVYASMDTGKEIREYRTPDGGATWSEAVVSATSGSTKKIRPVTPKGAEAVRVLWMQGTYTSFTDFNTGTYGAR